MSEMEQEITGQPEEIAVQAGEVVGRVGELQANQTNIMQEGLDVGVVGEVKAGQFQQFHQPQQSQQIQQFKQMRLKKRRAPRIRLLKYSPELEVYLNRKMVEVKDIKFVKGIKGIKGIEGKFKVFLVNGEFIRSNLEPDFTMGSHHFVSEYIPEGEVWIDDRLSEKDRLSLIYHEIHETKLMKKGMSYEEAHASATRAEMRFRRKMFKNSYKDLPLLFFCSVDAPNNTPNNVPNKNATNAMSNAKC